MEYLSLAGAVFLATIGFIMERRGSGGMVLLLTAYVLTLPVMVVSIWAWLGVSTILSTIAYVYRKDLHYVVCCLTPIPLTGIVLFSQIMVVS